MAEQPMSPIWANIAKVARKVFTLGTLIGELNVLKTADKGSLVAAINELHDNPQGNGDGVNESRVTELINARLDELKGGASSAFDTLGELEAQLKKDGSAVSAILNEIGTVKQTIQTLQADISALKTYVGIDNAEALSAAIDNSLTTGA